MADLPRVVIYTRPGCGLCDEAAHLVRQEGLEPEMVDIDQDPGLQRLYDLQVPVVEIDGAERFRGRVNPVLLRRVLRSVGPPRPRWFFWGRGRRD